MSGRFFVEAFGYLGSALVVVSMLMSSVVRLRIINLIGSIIFAVYALIIRSYPTALMNFFLVAINIYHLRRLISTQKHYTMMECEKPDTYVSYLLNYYGEDIRKFFPDFSAGMLKQQGHTRTFIVCCDHEVAGVLAGSGKSRDFDVLLDYSTPVYRDCSVGKYLYEKLPGYGIESLSYSGKCNTDHRQYLIKMGFKETSGVFVRQLK